MLHYNTVNDILKYTLSKLMDVSIFDGFRLVGGTALSLQIGHRESIDIDLFSDASYGSIDFKEIDTYLDEKPLNAYLLTLTRSRQRRHV